MFNFLDIFIALIIGLSLGLFYFGCLWLTVVQIPNSDHPVSLILGSFCLRLLLSLLVLSVLLKEGISLAIIIPAFLAGFFWMRNFFIDYLQCQ